MRDKVVPAMAKLRETGDSIEVPHAPRAVAPSTYREMLSSSDKRAADAARQYHQRAGSVPAPLRLRNVIGLSPPEKRPAGVRGAKQPV
jgi:hypothetical protein